MQEVRLLRLTETVRVVVREFVAAGMRREEILAESGEVSRLARKVIEKIVDEEMARLSIEKVPGCDHEYFATPMDHAAGRIKFCFKCGAANPT